MIIDTEKASEEAGYYDYYLSSSKNGFTVLTTTEPDNYTGPYYRLAYRNYQENGRATKNTLIFRKQKGEETTSIEEDKDPHSFVESKGIWTIKDKLQTYYSRNTYRVQDKQFIGKANKTETSNYKYQGGPNLKFDTLKYVNIPLVDLLGIPKLNLTNNDINPTDIITTENDLHIDWGPRIFAPSLWEKDAMIANWCYYTKKPRITIDFDGSFKTQDKTEKTPYFWNSETNSRLPFSTIDITTSFATGGKLESEIDYTKYEEGTKNTKKDTFILEEKYWTPFTITNWNPYSCSGSLFRKTCGYNEHYSNTQYFWSEGKGSITITAENKYGGPNYYSYDEDAPSSNHNELFESYKGSTEINPSDLDCPLIEEESIHNTLKDYETDENKSYYRYKETWGGSSYTATYYKNNIEKITINAEEDYYRGNEKPTWTKDNLNAKYYYSFYPINPPGLGNTIVTAYFGNLQIALPFFENNYSAYYNLLYTTPSEHKVTFADGTSATVKASYTNRFTSGDGLDKAAISQYVSFVDKLMVVNNGEGNKDIFFCQEDPDNSDSYYISAVPPHRKDRENVKPKETYYFDIILTK